MNNLQSKILNPQSSISGSLCRCLAATSKNKTLLTIYPPHLVKRVIDDAICEDVLVVTCKIRCDTCRTVFLATAPFPPS